MDVEFVRSGAVAVDVGKLTIFGRPLQADIRDAVHDAVFVPQYRSPTVAEVYTTIYRLTHSNAEARLRQLQAAMARHSDEGALPLPAGTHLLAPLGAPRGINSTLNGIEVVTGMYPWLFPVAGTQIIDDKFAEIEAHPDWLMLLPDNKPQVCVTDYNEQRRLLRRLLFAPYLPQPRRKVTVAKPFCDYINANYVLTSYASPLRHSFIWVRKAPHNPLTPPI